MASFPHVDVAAVAQLIGQDARAAILDALLGGQWLTATELTRHAEVSAATGSEHLARLVEGGLVVRRRNGRHVYHGLAGPEVAEALEDLGRIAACLHIRRPVPASLRFARSCYNHLAGQLGVFLCDALKESGWIGPNADRVTAAGEAWLLELGMDRRAIAEVDRAVIRPCLDWSERRDHLAGPVATGLMTLMVDRGWLARTKGSRALRLTIRGRDRLQQALEREIPPSPADRPTGREANGGLHLPHSE